VRRLGRAFMNMLRTAWRDPLWALLSMLFSPIIAGKYLLIFGALWAFVSYCVSILGLGLIKSLGIEDSWLSLFIIIPVLLIVIGLLVRILIRPLLDHFGDSGTDIHGSARFATKKEIAPFTRTPGRPGALLIGRDTYSKKPIWYQGPAHLLTMAPTRSGKGVGTLIPNLLMANRSILC
jgi:type IV secretion system protein VirD4